MCGLVGVAGNIAYGDTKAFKELLVADTFRGAHSTGVATIGLSKECAPDMLKTTLPAWDFLDLKQSSSIISSSAHMILGHNRHATRGEITKANAHPFFVEDDLLGMHNGTIELLQCSQFLDDHREYGTDSEAVLASFVKRGTKRTLENIVGAWAFVWYDYRDNTLNFTRNSQRPLHIAVDDEKAPTKIWWASESGMLRWILNRNNIKFAKIWDVGECQVVSWVMPDTLTAPFSKPKVWKYTEKKRPAPTYNYGYHGTGQTTHRPSPKSTSTNSTTGSSGSQQNTGQQTSGNSGSKDITTADLVKLKSIESIRGVLFPDWYDPDDPKSIWIHLDKHGEILDTEEEVRKYLLEADCSVCGAHIDPHERWRGFPNRVFVCESCAESPETPELLYDGGIAA